MHYFEYATKDTTLYESSASMNSGLDEILEIQKIGSSLEEIITVSRALIKFDLTDISSSVSNETITNPKYYLNLYDAGSEALNIEQTLYGYPVSQSWDMGSGRSDSNPVVAEGASWTYRDNDDTATAWTGSIITSVGNAYASGTLTINEGDYTNQEVIIDGVGFAFVSGSTEVFTNSATQLFVESGSTTGSSVGNLKNVINNNSSIHGLPIVAGGHGIDPDYLTLTGSSAGTIANLSAASSSVLFTFGGDATKALEGGTNATTATPLGGGTWYVGSGYEASQSFNHEPSDLRMDVTDIVNKWVDGTIPNEGFMLKRRGSMGNTNTNLEEGNMIHYGNFKFFSRETHTVFQPKLEVEWDDSTWTTGSLSALSNTDVEDMILYMKGVRPEYQETSKTKFRVVGRERYPVKTFSTTSDYLTVKTLPSGSTYYSIRDAHTEDVIIPFGSGSKVSCDSTGNYFNLWMNGLQSERFYRVLFKVVSGSGTAGETVQYFDENWTFKVSR
jgi:hypothetical protein|tara:strand:+ start:870 stop:2372 length:1503 start_codon:yes stop_codon:yes gene_type:complete